MPCASCDPGVGRLDGTSISPGGESHLGPFGAQFAAHRQDGVSCQILRQLELPVLAPVPFDFRGRRVTGVMSAPRRIVRLVLDQGIPRDAMAPGLAAMILDQKGTFDQIMMSRFRSGAHSTAIAAGAALSELGVTREQCGNRRLQLYGKRQLGQVDPLRVADPRRNRAASLLVARPSRSRPTIDHYELSVSPSRPFCNHAHRFACFVNAPSELL